MLHLQSWCSMLGVLMHSAAVTLGPFMLVPSHLLLMPWTLHCHPLLLSATAPAGHLAVGSDKKHCRHAEVYHNMVLHVLV